jgi:hypothetical protein
MLTTYERSYGPPTTCTLTAASDAYVREDSPATAFGAETTLEVRAQAGARGRSLLRFDLGACSPGIPADAIVRSASLRLTVVSADLTGSRTYDVSPISAAWSDATVTWGGQPGVAGLTASQAIAAGTLAGTNVEWSVVSDVQDFVAGASTHHGWRISDASEGSVLLEAVQFHSRESVTGLPTLVITYVG